MSLSEKIQAETSKAMESTQPYTEKLIHSLTTSLQAARKTIAYSVLKIKVNFLSTENVPVSAKGLEELETTLAKVIEEIKKESTILLKPVAMKAAKMGVDNGAKVLNMFKKIPNLTKTVPMH